MEYRTWQFYSTCNHVLGMEFMQQLFKRSRTQIYRWAADPDFTAEESSNRNPLDRILVLVSRLRELGRQDVAQSLAARLAHAAGGEFTAAPKPLAHKPITEEVMDVLPALARYHEVCKNPDSTLMDVRAAKDAIKRTLDNSEAAALEARSRERA